MSKVLGVLGGMGPAATVAFLARVQALTPAAGDQDHIRIIAGDDVSLELSPYDLTKGRINFRHIEGRAPMAPRTPKAPR